MNYTNAAVQSGHCKQAPRKRKHRCFVLNGIKLAMLIIPIILLTIVLTLELSSNGTDTAHRQDNDIVQAKGNGVQPSGSAIDDLHTVTFLPYIQDETKQKETEPVPAPLYTEYGEALVTDSDTEMAAVAWCILNRVDSSKYPNTIEEVVTQRRQFLGYNESHPVTARIENLVRDVLDRWYVVKDGLTDCGRVLPKDYIYFEGDGRHNHYSTEWLSDEYYDWSLPTPYKD